MTQVLASDQENQHEPTPAGEAWTEPAAGAAPPFWQQYEHARCHSGLAAAIAVTGLDHRGAEFILGMLAGWTCPPAMTTGPRAGPEENSQALASLRDYRGGYLVPAHDEPAAPSNPQEMVRWLYEESGLTWDQLARILGVSRRSVHAWANGQRVSGRNLERLSHVSSTIRAIEADSAVARRHALFSPRSNKQPNLFDELVIQARKATPPQDEDAFLRRLGIASED